MKNRGTIEWLLFAFVATFATLCCVRPEPLKMWETLFLMAAIFATCGIVIRCGCIRLLHYILLLFVGFMGWTVVVMIVVSIIEVCLQGSMSVEEDFMVTMAHWWLTWVFMAAFSVFAYEYVYSKKETK